MDRGGHRLPTAPRAVSRRGPMWPLEKRNSFRVKRIYIDLKARLSGTSYWSLYIQTLKYHEHYWLACQSPFCRYLPLHQQGDRRLRRDEETKEKNQETRQNLLKCINEGNMIYVLDEVHKWICRMHTGGRSMTARVIRARYYWPTLRENCTECIKKCKECQEFSSIHHAPPEVLHIITCPWPFAM